MLSVQSLSLKMKASKEYGDRGTDPKISTHDLKFLNKGHHDWMQLEGCQIQMSKNLDLKIAEE